MAKRFRVRGVWITAFLALVVVSLGAYAFIRHNLEGSPPSAKEASGQAASENAGVQSPGAESEPGTKPDESDTQSDQAEAEILNKARQALKDPELGTRMAAVQSLREILTAESVEILSLFLADEEEAVVNEALDTLAYIGLTEGKLSAVVFEKLLEKAKDKEFMARGSALIFASMFSQNDRVLPVIGEFVAEEGDEGKTVAVRAMTFIAKPECIPYLAQVLEKTQNQELLRNTFSLLAKIGSPQATALLESEVASGKGSRQASAVWALSRSANSPYSATLAGAVSRNALEEQSLGVIAKSPAAPAVFGNAFATGLSKDQKLYLFQVMQTYSMSAPGSVRNQTADMLKPLLNSSDPDLERAAIKALGKSGAIEDQSEVLAEKFESGDFLIRGAALEAFAQYCTPSNYQPLKLLWNDENQQIRRTAFFLSESFLNQSDLGDLQKATGSSDEFIAKHAGLMIKHITQGQKK